MNVKFQMPNFKCQIKPLYTLCLFVALSLCLTSIAVAQIAYSNCVVTKIGNPSGPTPELPTECNMAPGGMLFPPGMQGPNDKGYYQLPHAGDPSNGYTSLNCAERSWGSKELVGVLYTVAQRWKQRYPEGYLRIGDLNAQGHKTHNKGYAVDLDATTNGIDCVSGFIDRGAMGRSCASKYNRPATIELGKMFIDTKIINQILYNDTTVNAALSEYAASQSLDVEFFEVPLHDDHFHVDIKLQPLLTFWEPTC